MLFASARTGEGVIVEGSPKRQKVRYDAADLRLFRARTWRVWRAAGVDEDQLADAFRMDPEIVRSDLAWLDDQPDPDDED